MISYIESKNIELIETKSNGGFQGLGVRVGKWGMLAPKYKFLESPLDCKEIQPVHSKGDQPWDLFGRNDAKDETLVTLATSCKELTHWKRFWCWEELGAGGEGDDRGRDGWMASLTQWTWVWVNSRSWWWTARPVVLWFMESQRVGHDWVTDLIWSDNYIGLLWWVRGKDSTCNTGDCLQWRRRGFDPWDRKICWEGNDNLLQYFSLGNPMDRGTWWATVHGDTKSWTWLRDWACILQTTIWKVDIYFYKLLTLKPNF